MPVPVATRGAAERPRTLSGLAALPVQLRFCLSVLWKWAFHRRRYPLLVLSPARGGFLRTLALLERIKLTKVIRMGRKYHFSLVEPRWPSAAYEHLIAQGGLNLAAAGTPLKAQIDLAILGVTRTCPYRCAHCYEHYNLGPVDVVPVSAWREAIRGIQEVGVSVVALSGGEPLTAFERTARILDGADKSRSDFHLFTAGAGATPGRVRALVDAGLTAAAVGLDDYEASRHDRFRSHAGAYDEAVEAIRLFVDAGILVYVNVCLTKDLLARDGLHRLYDLVHGLGVAAVQLLEPKPCGGYAAGVQSLFGADERKSVRAFFEATHGRRRYAAHPVVYYPAYMEAAENLGCMMAGLSHLYVDSLGNVQPCVFLPVAFGNITREPFTDILGRMREAVPRPIHRACPALALADTVGFSRERAGTLPIPHGDVRGEWRRLYSRSPERPRAGD